MFHTFSYFPANDNIPWRVGPALVGVSARSDAHSPSPRGAPGLELTVRCRSESQELTTLDLEAEISAEPFVSAVGIKVGCEANCRDSRWPSEGYAVVDDECVVPAEAATGDMVARELETSMDGARVNETDKELHSCPSHADETSGRDRDKQSASLPVVPVVSDSSVPAANTEMLDPGWPPGRSKDVDRPSG